ncbi:LacI family DNA-binding transcriptional regulator [Entomospira entomophila]|uniref:LacI family transcriptional regulator n=1 Tax=Entomospira entomophila TaxID=2719988 RepID=A0A968GC27_9SPIO|nr:LacI family DNA-binding transcriptional regulator [Entomospira entomophilus]NIZ40868.1 LacI family transcriptional regulator [Entomospira entomophilus]WDI35081.1 LacI family DNA-binding transcriptional regulator [Entomospira entomophilus]
MAGKLRGIKAIAHEAGVAISTVSCVLNNTGRISSQTRERVLSIAKKHNYEPSFVAQSLKSKRTRVIGIFVVNYVGEFYSQLISGIDQGLSEEGYEFVVCHGARAQRFLGEGFLDGVIIFDAIISNREIENLIVAGKAVLLLDRCAPTSKVSTFLLDSRTGVHAAMQHLLELQYTEIHCITGSLSTYYMQERMDAVQQFLRDHPELVIHWHSSSVEQSSGYRVVKSVYARAYKRPLVFFVFSDQTALGIYEYARNNNLEIGRDIMVVGFDGLSVGKYLAPALSSVSFDTVSWGRKAAHLLVHQLAQPDLTPTHEVLPTELFIGASSYRIANS